MTHLVRAGAFALLVAFGILGCAPRIRLDRRPPGSDIVHTVPRGESPALLASVKTTLNGTEVAANESFRKRVIDKIREVGAFSSVSDTVASGEHPVELRLVATETTNPHTGAAFWKGFLVGATFFALSPVIPFHVDYSLDLTLDAQWPDGRTGHYESGSAGTLSLNYFQLMNQANGIKLTGEVSTAALNGLANALAHDDKPAGIGVEGENRAPTRGSSVRPAGDAEGRLQALQKLREKGLVSHEEYTTKRQEILDGM